MLQDIEMHESKALKYVFSIFPLWTCEFLFQITSRFQLEFINTFSHNLLVASQVTQMIMHIDQNYNSPCLFIVALAIL